MKTVLVSLAGRQVGDVMDVHVEDGRRFQIVVPPHTADNLYIDIPDNQDGGLIEIGGIPSSEKSSTTVMGGAALAGGLLGGLVLGKYYYYHCHYHYHY